MLSNVGLGQIRTCKNHRRTHHRYRSFCVPVRFSLFSYPSTNMGRRSSGGRSSSGGGFFGRSNTASKVRPLFHGDIGV